MKKIAIILTALFLGISTGIFAQDKPVKGPEGKEKHKGDMGLPNMTDQQKTEIKKLKTAHMKEVLPLKSQLKEKKAHLESLMITDAADMTAINKTIDEIGVLQTDLMKKGASHMQAVRKLLTEEQRVIFDMHSGKGMHGKGKGMGPGKGMHKKMMEEEGAEN